MIDDATKRLDVLLIGYERRENLGLRSIVSYLKALGYRAQLVPFEPESYEPVLRAVEQTNPRVIGFSLIFQFSLNEFGGLMHYLRQHGIATHFTAGGHFPSLHPGDTLRLLPELDSVVRFEGEQTLAELLNLLDTPSRWPEILGLAYRGSDDIVVNAPRPLIADLDSLPRLEHGEPQIIANDIRMASMLASRGCLFNCSFCSIRQFYGHAGGALRRSRSPGRVVEEMRDLYEQQGVNVFLFQDDDFAARSKRQRAWLREYLTELDRSGLGQKVKWKISCRVDDLDDDILDAMKEQGLVLVYLGVESGNEAGLRLMNKRVTVKQNIAAIDMLKRHEIGVLMGFMLLDPSSTFATVDANIAFLKEVGADGYFPINFCRMVPYAGTPIEAQLRAEGRLRGSVVEPDYDFMEPRMDWFAFFVNRIFRRRNNDVTGLVMRLSEAITDHCLGTAFAASSYPADYRANLQTLTRRANELATGTLATLMHKVQASPIDDLLQDQDVLLSIAEAEWRGEAEIDLDLEQLEMNLNAKASSAAVSPQETTEFTAP